MQRVSRPTSARAPPAGAPPASNWTSVEVVDPYTVRVNFTTWDNTIPATFGDSDPALYMVSKAAYDKNGQEWLTTNPVGTGPFTLVSYATDASAKLVKNPNYFRAAEGLPKFDFLEFVYFLDFAITF